MSVHDWAIAVLLALLSAALFRIGYQDEQLRELRNKNHRLSFRINALLNSRRPRT